MKITRSALPREFAVPEGYTSFFSFPITKGGYSGVAVYSKQSPQKAEAGLSGLAVLQPKPVLAVSERITPSYPDIDDLNFIPESDGVVPIALDLLDAEGRALVLDYGFFVLINTYCPNETSDARLPYKMNYHILLEARIRQLVAAGRQVILLGDINICAHPRDHCDGHLPSVKDTFWDTLPRQWLRDLIHPQTGIMVDIVRDFWPDRKSMYTCWNTKISARDTNYGTRVDYILITKGLIPWIKAGDIQPSIKGSDHCPIYIDMHDEIEVDGKQVKLQDLLRPPASVPRIAAEFWPEIRGRKTLDTFFGGGSKRKPGPSTIGGQSTIKKARTDQQAPETAEHDDQVEADRLYAIQLSQESSDSSPRRAGAQKRIWTEMMAPPKPPLCTVHQEPAKLFTVNKPGPNKGKTFFVCSRPVGPGYDKGHSERKREEVDTQYKCNFFRWSSEVKRDASSQ